ncbi:hypothetical protein HY625_01505 [Candidatus Uhrbacteria bacterium]|nr:hypothetical protein [Candidatus Uhrbacteria bacterium]
MEVGAVGRSGRYYGGVNSGRRKSVSSSQGIVCPKCGKGGDQKVLDSRPRLNEIYRRRVCGSCGNRFATYERKSITTCFVVVHTVEEDGRVRTQTFQVVSGSGIKVVISDNNEVVTTSIKKPRTRKIVS